MTLKTIQPSASDEAAVTKNTDTMSTETEEQVHSEQAEPEKKKPSRRPIDKKIRKAERRITNLQRFGIQFLAFAVILYILFGHMIGFVSAPNDDMYPRIDAGDLVMFSRLDIDPRAQEIIYFVKNDTRYLGRVIAVGGDTVEITEDGAVRVNGSNMIESNIFFETYPLEGFTAYPLTLSPGEFFVLADRRGGSEDSRYFGPVLYDEIQGEVITVAKRTNI